MTPIECGIFGLGGRAGSLGLWMALLTIVHAVGLAGVVLLDGIVMLVQVYGTGGS